MVTGSWIWWLWTAFSPPQIHTFWVGGEQDDIAWLGEAGWAKDDNIGLGLRTVTQ